MNEPNAVIEKAVDSPQLLDISTLDDAQLGEMIVGCHRSATTMAAAASNATRAALELALKAGHALNEAKRRCGHGEWGDWLKQHVPDLAQDRANRYMRMAKEIADVRNFDEIKTVRQAFIAVGILRESSKGGGKKTAAPVLDRDTALEPADFVSRFRALRVFLEHAKPRLLAGEIPLAEVTEMAGEVDAILALFRDLQGHLEKPPASPLPSSPPTTMHTSPTSPPSPSSTPLPPMASPPPATGSAGTPSIQDR